MEFQFTKEQLRVLKSMKDRHERSHDYDTPFMASIHTRSRG